MKFAKGKLRTINWNNDTIRDKVIHF